MNTSSIILDPGGNAHTPLQTDPGSLSLLASLTALHDWIKIFLLGGLFETSRRLLSLLLYHLTESFFITAEFDEHDETYVWMMFWLSRQKAWTQARNVNVSTREFGQSRYTDFIPGEVVNSPQTKKEMAHLPAHDHSHYLWYKRSLLQVTRLRFSSREGWQLRKDDKLVIRIFTRSHGPLNTLLLEAKLLYKSEGKDRIDIYVADEYNDWLLASSRAKRPLSSVVLEKEIKDTLLMDCKDFMESETWYVERGIPWRRGYLLHGTPGSGKTSLVHALAGELGLAIYVVSLSKRGLDDSVLNSLVSRLPSKSIALIEDIDAAFYRGLSREPIVPPPTFDYDSNPSSHPTAASVGGPPCSTPSITLAGLLSAIDGITAQEGRILFASTNKYEALDPALVRPGRLDVHVRFGLASQRQARELFECFYSPNVEDEMEDLGQEVELEKGLIGIDDQRWEQEEEEDILSEGSETCSSTESSVTYASYLTRDDAFCQLTHKQVKELASLFACRIPNRAVSMAAIQGHLMKFKTRPKEAVAAVETWIKEEHDRTHRKNNGDSLAMNNDIKCIAFGDSDVGLLTASA